jgi:hypothetical protein
MHPGWPGKCLKGRSSVIKPVREALLLINDKAPQTKAYLSGAQAILLVFVVKSFSPREEKYKAKAAIDTFFVRGGDALAALCVFIGTTYFALAIEKFAVINVLMVLVWIAGQRLRSFNLMIPPESWVI